MPEVESRQIKVIIFSPHSLVGGGGVSTFTTLLRNRLGPGVAAEPFFIGQRPGRLGSRFRLFFPIYDALRLACLALRSRYDVYHLNPSFDRRSVMREALFMSILRLLGKRKVLVFFHGWDSDYSRRVSQSSFSRLLFQFSYGWAPQILVLAPQFARELHQLGVRRESISIVSTMFDGSDLRAARRARSDSAIWVLFMARFVAAKGIYELLDAFREANSLNPDLYLVMAGDGPEARRAREVCASYGLLNRVKFTGYISGLPKAQLLADSDVFVLPTSHGEGCPIALLEAMAAGMAVIATPVGGIPQIIRHEVNGLLLDANDSRSVADALVLLANDANLRREMGQRNRSEAWLKYESHSMADKLEAFYRQILKFS